MALGVMLVIVGLVFLLNALGVIPGVSFRELWPVILIAAGVTLIYDRIRRSWRRR